jgi:hypothetical protein
MHSYVMIPSLKKGHKELIFKLLLKTIPMLHHII